MCGSGDDGQAARRWYCTPLPGNVTRRYALSLAGNVSSIRIFKARLFRKETRCGSPDGLGWPCRREQTSRREACAGTLEHYRRLQGQAGRPLRAPDYRRHLKISALSAHAGRPSRCTRPDMATPPSRPDRSSPACETSTSGHSPTTPCASARKPADQAGGWFATLYPADAVAAARNDQSRPSIAHKRFHAEQVWRTAKFLFLGMSPADASKADKRNGSHSVRPNHGVGDSSCHCEPAPDRCRYHEKATRCL